MANHLIPRPAACPRAPRTDTPHRPTASPHLFHAEVADVARFGPCPGSGALSVTPRAEWQTTVDRERTVLARFMRLNQICRSEGLQRRAGDAKRERTGAGPRGSETRRRAPREFYPVSRRAKVRANSAGVCPSLESAPCARRRSADGDDLLFGETAEPRAPVLEPGRCELQTGMGRRGHVRSDGHGSIRGLFRHRSFGARLAEAARRVCRVLICVMTGVALVVSLLLGPESCD